MRPFPVPRVPTLLGIREAGFFLRDLYVAKDRPLGNYRRTIITAAGLLKVEEPPLILIFHTEFLLLLCVCLSEYEIELRSYSFFLF